MQKTTTRFVVQEKAETGKWFSLNTTQGKTLEEAQENFKKELAYRKNMNSFISMGKRGETRFVKRTVIIEPI